MGNQLAGIAPSQIYPVEHYLTELPDFTYEKNLGSTRFLKVARVKHKEGLAIVKVFAIHDPSLPLAPHKEALEKIKQVLANVPNTLPFQKVVETDKAGMVIRQFVKDNLYDRISTRPFLNSIEKRWIAFQLLHALAACHLHGICHGDIKLENIMVTGWNWALLTDFASFKPTYLPEDNPADFSYFFDTSRRRTCYIAPERFVKTLNPDSSHFLPEEGIGTGELTPAMDIFSLGCVLTELFTEGHPPFDFSQLLSYRSGEYNPSKILEKIEDVQLREFISHMLRRDPSERLSAEEYLESQRDRVFPQYLYTFLYDYVKEFATLALTPDEKVARLRQDIHAILYSLVSSKHSRAVDPLVGCEGDHEERGNPGSDGLLIVVALLTSCRLTLHCMIESQDKAYPYCQNGEIYLKHPLLEQISKGKSLYLVNDKYPRVRAAAVETLTACLTLVKTVPRSDANVFPEYILPNLMHVTQDNAVIVRMALAENIAVLAETALRFLEMTTQHEVGSPDGTNSEVNAQAQHHHHQGSFESELQALHEMIQQAVSTLLSDSNNIVKQMLLEKGITQLCVFFGKQKGRSRPFAFLSQEDRHLRGSFFDSIVGVSAYVGWQCSPILKPLLQQGLADTEEFVISKTLRAMTELAQMGLFRKQMLYELTAETISLLYHPNKWIRQYTVGFVCAVTASLSLADIQCKLKPMLQPYLKHPVIEVDKEVVVLSSVHEPLPRIMFDYLIKLPNLPNLLESLRDRQVLRSIVRAGHPPSYSEMDHTLKSVYRRLQSDGMTESMEDKILAMKEHLLKIQKYKRRCIMGDMLHHLKHNGTKSIAHLSLYMQHLQKLSISTSGIHQRQRKRLSQSNTNEDWQRMFGTVEARSSSPQKQLQLQQQHSPAGDTELHVSGAESADSAVPSSNTSPKQPHKSFCGIAVDSVNRPTHAAHSLSCHAELQLLLKKKRYEFAREQTIREASDDPSKEEKALPSKWRPRGTLVAHMHEHRGAIHRLEVIPNTSLFATCSADGSVKIWDWGRMEKKTIANRSRQTYARMDGQVTCMCVCQGMQSLAIASDAGTIQVFRIETASTKTTVIRSRSLDPHEDGCVVDLHHFDTGIQSVLAYATVYGSIVGWDLRSPSTAWNLENNPRNGVITSFCVDPQHSWLVCGTSDGKLVCWDMRFQLPINTITHPSGSRVRQVHVDPQYQSGVWAAVQGNNEVSLWDMETEARLRTLWASSYPPLTECQATPHSIFSMYLSPVECGPFMLTGGSDMNIRFWDMNNPLSSYVVAGAAIDTHTRVVSYRQVSDHCRPTVHIATQRRNTSGTEEPRRYPEQPAAGHNDCISDLGVIQTSQTFVVSASKNGVVKVWK
ncbi:phosphoinositide 3-kinase regulatory subunit, putative [Ixodes scapularis]|uniref:non-specific serine/threonine protein kinase n=1 Tax=Ixodes scapularis TaxID=6945 RepID=B7PJP7_IXOSC|nr:phosphoinositide 3-kinase regulatory subunit, putative [Ixodes scapularis]|eukprot:XP_002408377.1 phosphoinositide 3-kinase regulatory subunit, putative [Ixodes scapularis]